MVIQRNRADVNALFKEEHDRWGGREGVAGVGREAGGLPPCMLRRAVEAAPFGMRAPHLRDRQASRSQHWLGAFRALRLCRLSTGCRCAHPPVQDCPGAGGDQAGVGGGAGADCEAEAQPGQGAGEECE